jgi:hypothetical protein
MSILDAIMGTQTLPQATQMNPTAGGLQQQGNRVVEMIRKATQANQPSLGDELQRDPAQNSQFYQNLAKISMGSAPTQGIYNAGQSAIDDSRNRRADMAKQDLSAETDVYNTMQQLKQMGDAEATKIDATIESLVGNDPAKKKALYDELHKDPDELNSTNIATKATNAAAKLGLYNEFERTDLSYKKAQIENMSNKANDMKVVGNQIVRMNRATGEVEPVYTAPSTAPINPETGLPERKLSSAEQKEYFDTIDLKNSGEAAINALTKAKDILTSSPEGSEPYTGFAAETRAAAARIPVIGGVVADKERGAATTEYKTLVTEQALNSLKAIFGGMPTEGERAILMQMQALPTYTPQEQQRIIDNAIEAASTRLSFNSDKANTILTGQYSTFAKGKTAAPLALSGNAQAQAIKQQYKSGQITKEQAEAALDVLSGGQ